CDGKERQHRCRQVCQGGVRKKAERLVDVNTVRHTDARDVGAEWICLQAIRELEIDRFLERQGWNEIQINTTLAHLITRTVYTPSELKSIRIMNENSAVCELVSGNQEWHPGYHDIYKVAPNLYGLKDKLEPHLCRKTDDLFNLTNRIVLFDLTNFYFEGRKERSSKAQYGRSKEKRNDCKLLVMALCVNAEGFIRYSSILAGNTADPDSLPDMIDTLSQKTRTPSDPERKVLVCLDAGIATEDNLRKIKEKDYNYLCVSRTRLTDYEISEDCQSVKVLDTRKQEITLRQVKHKADGDYYLEINSPAKAVKESSMNRQWRERFEQELTKAREALGRKGGKKNYEKVIERVGRAIQKYPSIAKYYVIDYLRDEKNPKNMADIQWRIAVPENVDRQSGIYFLRTNVERLDEKSTWDYYNLIREIECTNRQLKTDLNLRPIYHKKDDCSDAHLFLGLLSYWIVNAIRYKLKQTGENCFWTEIVRRMSTQKAITTEGVNALGEKVSLRLCSEPSKAAEDIYERLKYRKMPFRKIQIPKSL
ncbi:MAG: IS1634 family transposase, partial [Paraprevotella sp.]|nr:IS1634 family transposase [Paraprevotella sp.]